VEQEDIREAGLMRDADFFGVTYFLDVADLWKKAERAGCQDLFLKRYEPGAIVTRVNNFQLPPPRDRNRYHIGGATIIATNEPVSQIMESRAFPIMMPHVDRNFPMPTPELGLPFRERLVAWRAHRLGQRLPDPKELTTGRLQDISVPLWQIIRMVSPRHLPEFEELIQKLDREQRNSRAYSLEAEIIGVVTALAAGANPGVVAVEDIASQVNIIRAKERSYPISVDRLGKKLRSLGFEPNPRHAGQRSIIVEPSQLEALAKKYGLVDTGATKASEASQPSQHFVGLGTLDESKPSPLGQPSQGDTWDVGDTSSRGVPTKGEQACREGPIDLDLL
jgi:hypothetical protein